jgi:hypothetical protein
MNFLFSSKTKIIILFVFIFTTFLAVSFYLVQFHSSNIIFALPSNDHQNAPLMDQEIKSLFDRPFTYLGEGNQAYAFTSADGKYVVKFFKKAPLKTSSWLEPLSFIPSINSYLIHNKQRGQRKFERVFNAYKIAYLHDRLNCGLEYIHLNQSNNLKITAHIIDTFGIHHQIDLDKYTFVIQRKGKPLKTLLKKDISEGKIEQAKQRLKQVIEMYLDEYQKGIFDHDHNLMANIGFVEERPLRIDVGKLVLDPAYTKRDIYREDLDKIIHQRIAKWFKRYAPEHSNEIRETLEPYLE